MATSIIIVAVVLVLLTNVRAQSSSPSSSSADVSVSVVNTTDACGQDEYNGSCWYAVTCKTCLSRAGCAVEVSSGRCVSSSSLAVTEAAVAGSSSNDIASAKFFVSDEAKYCSSIDPACFTCRRVNAPAVCIGSDGCVCVSQCEQISTQATKCLPSGVGGMSSSSLIAAAAVLCPLVAYMIFKGSPCSSSCSMRRLLQRRRRDKNHRNLPGGLKLDAWRNHLKERTEPVDEQFADLELRSCFVPMESGRRLHLPRAGGNDGAETGERVHVEAGEEVSHAVAATDLPFSPTGRSVVDDRTEAELV
ncbi:hypothetical protein V7S43_000943 [Phytophthora oleae]|uniref:Membrane-associated protein n=1 Tax=Phytophthora oleae TaxID=2107226 RepID=A0ABD3G5D5_9STRA